MVIGIAGVQKGERMRLIDADALWMDVIHSVDYCDDFLEFIERQPTIEPERKTGKWILYDNQRQEDVDCGNYLYICSECGYSDLHAKTQDVPYCWYCGAKMEVGG